MKVEMSVLVNFTLQVIHKFFLCGKRREGER